MGNFMEKEVILFEEIATEIMNVRGNKWNSKSHVDVTMLTSSIYAACKTYKASMEEIDEITCYLYEAGIKKPCVVAVRGCDDDDWALLWGREIEVDSDGPVIFNARITGVYECFSDISDALKHIGKKYMLSWTHLPYLEYDREGYCAFYEEYELCNSISSTRDTPLPAKTVAVSEMLKEYPTLDELKKISAITEADLEYGFKLYKPVDEKPCFIMVGDKILCNNHSLRRLPYLFNAEGYEDDSYMTHEEGDLFIRDCEWDPDGGIGIRYRKGWIYDWR